MKERLRTLLERAGGAPALPELSRSSGVSEAALAGALVGDLSLWSTGMVERVARALGLDGATLWSPDPLQAMPTLKFLRGSSWPDFHADDLAPLLGALRGSVHFEELGSSDGSSRLGFGPLPVTSPPYRQGYKLAQRVRAAVGNPSEVIPSLHDLAQRDLGILVVHAKLKTARLSAVTIAASPHVAIVLNSARENRPVMQRRSIAHELCHALFDPPTDGMLAVLDADLDGGDDDASEQRAGAFAAELLVPEAGLIDLLGIPESVTELDVAAGLTTRAAAAFGAPSKLAANHLVNRRFVHKSLRESLVARVGGVVPKCKDVATVSLETRVRRAFRDGAISAGRAREILTLSHHEALPFDLGS